MKYSFAVILLMLFVGTSVQAQEATPEPSSTPLGSSIPFQNGISVVLYGNDTTMEGNTVRFFDDLERRDLGVTSIIFTFPIFQDGVNATTLYADPELTPSVENVRIYVREAHRRGYSIWLKPLIDDERTGAWRGAITPGGDLSNLEALDAWFASYGELLTQYAVLAQEEGVLGLVIGAEMESLDKPDEKYTIRWNGLIATLRTVYSGNLSYAKNWTPVDPSQIPGFVPNLDVLMIDAFFDLSRLADNASSGDIYYAWQEWLPYLQQYHERSGKPIMFAEVGVVPRVGAFRNPWNGNNGGRFDPTVQVRYYEGTCQFLSDFGDSFSFSGAYWWAVGFYDNFENQMTRATEQGIITYNFYDMPAEDTVRVCHGS